MEADEHGHEERRSGRGAGRTEIEVACKDCMVGAVAVLGDGWAGNETNEHGKEGGKETHGMVF